MISLKNQAFLLQVIALYSPLIHGFNVILAGGTGELGRSLSASLAKDGHDVTVLCRNAFLAAAPARVSSDFGWLGRSFLEKNPGIKLRDWDGGDLLDIVGQDWLVSLAYCIVHYCNPDWQDDTLSKADAVVNLVGGYTQQREMAQERIVRESLRVNPMALQITVGPKDEELKIITPGAYAVKVARLRHCEDLVSVNCARYECIRIEANRIDESCERIKKAIYDRLG